MKHKNNSKTKEKDKKIDVYFKPMEADISDETKIAKTEEDSNKVSKSKKIKRKRTYAVNEEIVNKLRKTESKHDLIKSKCIFSDFDKSDDIHLSEDKLKAIYEGGGGYHYICHTLPEEIDEWVITYSIKNKLDNIAIGYGTLPIFQKSPFSSPELCMYLLNNGEAYERGNLVYENGIIPTNLIYPLKVKVNYSKEMQKLKYSFGGYTNIYCFNEVPNEFIPCFVIWSNKNQEITIESISY